jgi:hypothetical protein
MYLAEDIGQVVEIRGVISVQAFARDEDLLEKRTGTIDCRGCGFGCHEVILRSAATHPDAAKHQPI